MTIIPGATHSLGTGTLSMGRHSCAIPAPAVFKEAVIIFIPESPYHRIIFSIFYTSSTPPP